MSSSQGVCRLKIPPTNECNEHSLLKGVLLSIGGGMGHYLPIAHVGI